MPVKLKDAEAAMNAMTGVNFFDTLQKNLSAHDHCHLSKTNALAALGPEKSTCGYYFKIKTETVFVKKGEPTLSKPELSRRDKKQDWQKKEIVTELPISLTEMAELCYTGMSAICLKWAEPSKLKDVRFLRITAFRPGYGGSTLRASGATACVGIAVVISVQVGVSPQIVTHFPIAQADIDSKTALV